MTAERRCWWCGFAAVVDTGDPEPHNGLLRDDGTLDGSESWICADNDACIRRAQERRW